MPYEARQKTYETEEDVSQPLDPERRLLVAIVERALFDIIGIDRNNQLNAFRWIFIEHSTDPFSFQWSCTELDLDPDMIRGSVTLMFDNVKAERERLKFARPERRIAGNQVGRW
jgi:hypothetical protein